jgi:hypothetical protein
MENALISVPVLPLRAEPSERAEQVTQLLYGEQVELLENQDGWSLVQNRADGYQGWATSKMLTPVSAPFLARLDTYDSFLLAEPLVFFRGVDVGQLYLPAGSKILHKGNRYYFPLDEQLIELFPEKEIQRISPTFPMPERILETAFQFLNAPYLWGGKTILGMDCSGLLQVAASINGFQMPRDAKDQAMLGEEQFLSLALPGDVAFFSNADGRIVHVGLLCGPHEILHASGCVRVDTLDGRGIFNNNLKKYTHQLHSIKRIFPA